MILSEYQIKERIKTLRNAKGIKQADFAKIVNVSQGAYSNLEGGNTELTLDKVNRIAEALDVNVEYLLFGNDEKIQTDTEKESVIKELEKEVQSIKKDFISVINSVLENYLEVILQGFVFRQQMPDLVPMLEDPNKWENIIESFNEDKMAISIHKIKKDFKNNQIGTEHEFLITSLFYPLSSIDIGFYIKEGYIKNIIIINAFKYFEEKILPQYSKF
ncbi:MAG: helix-turn-helix domain-containing protein [Raineya sp.]|jgi:transcriptional regulator with XRE-family HTH domain|nr:helix-turn-helix domain-containing protein [Raineya sp.]